MSALCACVVASLLVTSCQKDGQRFSNSERKTADSLVKAAGSTDSLRILCDKYIAEGNALGSITALKELGKRCRNESNFDEALAYHSKGLAIAEQVHDTLEIVQALNNIGTDYRRLGVLESATPYHYRAWKISEECSDTTYNAMKNMVVSLNGLGNVYLTTGNYDKAEDVFRLALAGEKVLKSSLGQAINYANLGSIFEHRGQLDSAWLYYRQSMEFNQKAKSILGISLCHNYFGSLYEQEGDFEKAIKEYKASRKMMEASKDEWHSLNSLISLINLYIKTGQEDVAARELPVAKEVADRINSNEHRAEICNLYYLFNKRIGNWSKALEYHEKAADLQKSLVDMNKLNHIQSLSIAIEREQQERHIKEAEQKYLAEKTFRKSVFFILGSVILLLLGLMTMLSYSMRVRKRSIDLLKNLSELRESLFVNITHELRTPLTIITGLNREIDKYAFNEEKVRELSSVVDRHGKTLLTLVNQLLDIAKIKSAPGEPDWRHGDMKVYVGMIADSYREYAQGRKQS
jgi:Signal transduction histidine kinase